MKDQNADRTVNVWTCPAATRAIATLGLNYPLINIVKVRSHESWMDKQELNELRHQNNVFISYFHGIILFVMTSFGEITLM